MSEKDIEKINEQEIDLKDLIMHLCLRWRMILIWMIIGAVMLGALGAIKILLETREAQRLLGISKETSEQSQEEALQTLREGLTDIEIAEVERIFESYQNMTRNCDSAVKYNSQSIKMQLNPYEVSTILLGYYVNNHYQVVHPDIDKQDNTADIITTLQESIMDTSTFELILQEFGWEKDAEYVRELITTYNSGNILFFEIMAPEQEDCEMMRDVIMNKVLVRSEELQDIFEEFDITIVKNQYTVEVNTTLLAEQTSLEQGIYDLRSNYLALESGLSEPQLKYLSKLKSMLLQIPDENKVNESSKLPISNLFSVKYVLFGGLCGVFFYCLWLILKYVLSDRLHTVEELTLKYNIRILATIENLRETNGKRHSKNIIDKFIYNIFTNGELMLNYEEAIPMIQSQIRVLAGNIGINSIYVTSTCGTSKCIETQKSICKKNEKDTYAILGGSEILRNPEELEKMGRCDGVLLIEQMDTSRHGRIRQLLCFCAQNKIQIIGCVFIR